ncbi:multi-sensor hybrid histidine kinase : Multi-sensor hybrid histidine kinase OS=Planctomyces brasiliensis (strain ATCC 49424 / DSM 5305 / JCM 21570 / NBRC 103401 / IFAM 1448) GN=Plabr_1025 PE=4 SV=1: Response_reg: PAS_3: GAF: HisKA: HATPase_c: Response_reg [Gemmata massiliana]|uniref:histidine kinase n=1 Tax=Gemmata massiliana TaxID=1210884 RepID=A0A6P2D6Y0_9BACT|nr:response regulator [Gemmata massiliana]VTR95894.1 multi-sensor hybrid histidine kinase : Multi-sensor hybrid histidine kinase OS=Planctomyces brasiliensis (strain ATCC 49424 / DSM 5305 / JCM 21570 / NBRC 103401 / IFAM 1448) GN=Plabr_1025 PE=4 SV=1: Response_reg: PAS_3: GAF: HisKA: HATPase_c: Response_reg [Gemmata massiliana]
MRVSILHLEDSDLDAELIAQRLTRAGVVSELVRACDRTEFQDQLTADRPFDVVLSDYQLPDIDGLEALELMRAHRPNVPFIFVSGALGEERAVETLKLGATDYILKHRLERLVPAIERAVTEARDRADRLAAEHAAREASERLALAQTAGRSGVFDWLIPEGRVVWSPELENLYGIPHGSFEGNFAGWEKRVVPEDAALVRALVGQHLTVRAEDIGYEFRVVLPDGRLRWLAGKAKFFYTPDGSPARMIGINVDIHDRKEMEEQLRAGKESLRQQNERLTLLADAAESLLAANGDPEHMMRALFDRVSDGLGLSHYFNYEPNEDGSALDLVSCTGVPAAEVESIRRLDFGQAVCGTVALTRKPVVATAVQSSADPKVQLVRGYGVRAYACNPLLAGDRFLGTLSFATNTRDQFSDEDMEVLRTICHYVAMAKEHQRLAAEARDRAERLKEQDRRKDEFLALLAHELRNPLAPLRNGLQVLKITEGRGESATRAREMMERQLAHTVRLIDDLLDISRISQNKLNLQRAPITLAEVIDSAVETARPLIDAAEHTLTVTLPSEPIVLDADLTRLAQVFSNLLTNSAKYTPQGGRIALDAALRSGSLVVTVRDSGLGIPADYLPRIFDMFSQADRVVERVTGGLGIGLALVKGLVEMHGGTVEAQSDGPGTGSTFTVRLPVLSGANEREDEVPGSPPVTANGTKRRVLVVDDNHDAAESLAQLLELLGNEVHVGHDGLEAVEVAERVRPDLILMDVRMPRLNGLDATARIRERSWATATTIVALTGWGQDSDRERTTAAGCDGHLVKPVLLADLERVLGENSRVASSHNS